MYSFGNEENKPMIEMRAENQMTMSYAFSNNAHECKVGLTKLAGVPGWLPSLWPLTVLPAAPYLLALRDTPLFCHYGTREA